MAFQVEAESDKKDPVIEVTSLFTTDPPEFSAKEAVNGSGVDPNRSYIDRVKAFPTNIETRSTLTFMAGGGMFNPFRRLEFNPQNVSGITTRSITAS
jgi:hypothetical protein